MPHNQAPELASVWRVNLAIFVGSGASGGIEAFGQPLTKAFPAATPESSLRDLTRRGMLGWEGQPGPPGIFSLPVEGSELDEPAQSSAMTVGPS